MPYHPGPRPEDYPERLAPRTCDGGEAIAREQVINLRAAIGGPLFDALEALEPIERKESD